MVRIISIALLAHAALLHGQQPPETEAPAEEPSPRAIYAAAVAAEKATRAAATRDAEADYERVAAAVRSASASLTEDARRRLETSGPSVAARQKRAAALVDIEANHDHAIEAAARDYTPAAEAILNTVGDAVASVRTELEIYEAVMTVAAEALDSRQSAASGSAREQQASESNYRTASAALEEAQRTLDAAREAYARISKREPDFDSYKTSTVGALLAGLTAGIAEAAGDRATSRQIQESEAANRNQASSSWEAAYAAWEANLAEANSAVKAAEEAQDAAFERAGRAHGRYNSAAESGDAASGEHAAALDAREAAKFDAAMVSSVLDWTEFEAVEVVLRNTAVSVVAELDTEALNTVTSAGAADALRAALDRYADLRPAALDAALAVIETERTTTLEAARAGLKDRYDGEVPSKARELEAACTEAQAGYEQALERAYRALDTALLPSRASDRTRGTDPGTGLPSKRRSPDTLPLRTRREQYVAAPSPDAFPRPAHSFPPSRPNWLLRRLRTPSQQPSEALSLRVETPPPQSANTGNIAATPTSSSERRFWGSTGPGSRWPSRSVLPKACRVPWRRPSREPSRPGNSWSTRFPTS